MSENNEEKDMGSQDNSRELNETRHLLDIEEMDTYNLDETETLEAQEKTAIQSIRSVLNTDGSAPNISEQTMTQHRNIVLLPPFNPPSGSYGTDNIGNLPEQFTTTQNLPPPQTNTGGEPSKNTATNGYTQRSPSMKRDLHARNAPPRTNIKQHKWWNTRTKDQGRYRIPSTFKLPTSPSQQCACFRLLFPRERAIKISNNIGAQSTNVVQYRNPHIVITINESPNATVAIKSTNKNEVVKTILDLLNIAYTQPIRQLRMLLYNNAIARVYGKETGVIHHIQGNYIGATVEPYTYYAPQCEEIVLKIMGTQQQISGVLKQLNEIIQFRALAPINRHYYPNLVADRAYQLRWGGYSEHKTPGILGQSAHPNRPRYPSLFDEPRPLKDDRFTKNINTNSIITSGRTYSYKTIKDTSSRFRPNNVHNPRKYFPTTTNPFPLYGRYEEIRRC